MIVQLRTLLNEALLLPYIRFTKIKEDKNNNKTTKKKSALHCQCNNLQTGTGNAGNFFSLPYPPNKHERTNGSHESDVLFSE